MSDNFTSQQKIGFPGQDHTLNKSKRFLKRHYKRLMGLGLMGLLLGIGIPMTQTQFSTPDTESTEASDIKRLPVETIVVESVSAYEVARTYTGEMASQRSSDLGFERTGQLVAVYVQEGDRVSIGQPLAQLDIQNLEIQKRQLEAQRVEAAALLMELEQGARQEDIEAAQAQVRDIENQLRLQEAQRSRREYLYNEGAISQDALDEFTYGTEALKARRDRAQSELDELINGTRPEQIAAQRAVIERITATIADIDVNISKSTLTAPFDAIVSNRQVHEGAVLSVGQSVLRLVEDDAPEARVGMPVTITSQLQVGDYQTLLIDHQTYSATVASILPEVDPDTRTQVVVLRLEPSVLPRINPGQTVRVEQIETISTEGVWLPTDALTQGIRGLWNCYVVVRPNAIGTSYEVQPQSVEILHQEDNRVLVRGTLQPGDRVVVSGVHRLVPGQQVQPLNLTTQLPSEIEYF